MQPIKNIFFKIIRNENLMGFIQHIFFYMFWIFDFSTSWQTKILLWRVRNNTLVNYFRLRDLCNACEKVSADHLAGAFVECGVWRGGCAGILSYFAAKSQDPVHEVFLFDSFEGLPKPAELDGNDAKVWTETTNSGELSPVGKNVASQKDVETLLFKNLGLGEFKAHIHIVKGWFQQTLPLAQKKIGGIAILRLDGDWYDSTKICIDTLYDNVVSGGYVIFDDYYFWEGCRKATDEFLKARNISVTLTSSGFSGAYFVKP